MNNNVPRSKYHRYWLHLKDAGTLTLKFDRNTPRAELDEEIFKYRKNITKRKIQDVIYNAENPVMQIKYEVNLEEFTLVATLEINVSLFSSNQINVEIM